jgi:hypothetical protein
VNDTETTPALDHSGAAGESLTYGFSIDELTEFVVFLRQTAAGVDLDDPDLVAALLHAWRLRSIRH